MSADRITIIVPRELSVRFVAATLYATFPEHTTNSTFGAFMRFDHSRPCWAAQNWREEYR